MKTTLFASNNPSPTLPKMPPLLLLNHYNEKAPGMRANVARSICQELSFTFFIRNDAQSTTRIRCADPIDIVRSLRGRARQAYNRLAFSDAIVAIAPN